MKSRVIKALFLTALASSWLSGCTLEGDTVDTNRVEVDVRPVSAPLLIETEHGYENYTDQSWTIAAPQGAESVTFTFERFETERGYDFLEISNSRGTRLYRLSGVQTGQTITVEDRIVNLRFISDYSVTRWGFRINGYEYELGRPTDHRPYCGAIGSRSEGWYWGDTDELIKWERCAEAAAPECGAIGSRSEGWYSEDAGLIVWDSCRATVGIAIAGETCGPSINVDCHDGLYCQGIPEDRLGATGTCRPQGYCETTADCELEENPWIHPACLGHASCDLDSSSCVWECGSTPMGPQSWTTVLLRDVESAHPYDNNFSNTWDVTHEGALAIRVHFARIDTEAGYDRLIFSGDREEDAVMVEGHREDYWTPELNGDTLHVTLDTDYSVTDWGFRANMVGLLLQLNEGQCNRDEDCQPGALCNVPRCFNPYSPCIGRCTRNDTCDDGSPLTCTAEPPTCEPGSTLAYQDGCFACVDPETCEPPASGGEGAPCDDARPCDDGLFCKTIGDDGVGECHDELWCDDATVEADCASVMHIAVPGQWACGEEHRCAWVPTMTRGSWSNDDGAVIPDNDPAGVTSELFPAGLAPGAVDVSLDLVIDHSYIGDLVVGLTDPAGNRAVIHDRAGGSTDSLVFEGLPVEGLGDEGGNGGWILDLSDHAGDDVGTLEHWALHLTCR